MPTQMAGRSRSGSKMGLEALPCGAVEPDAVPWATAGDDVPVEQALTSVVDDADPASRAHNGVRAGSSVSEAERKRRPRNPVISTATSSGVNDW